MLAMPAAPNAPPFQPDRILGRKRKAEPTQENERLTKKLSLLNIEQNGHTTYLHAPIIPTPLPSQTPPPPTITSSASSSAPSYYDTAMRIDDTKHKVYIYNIDEELAQDADSSNTTLAFHPDMERCLKQSRIPPQVLANPDGELAGMQMVLYSDPKSLSVPEARDGVRRAIIDARRRIRHRQAGIIDPHDNVHDDKQQQQAIGSQQDTDTPSKYTPNQYESDDIMDID